MCLHFYMVSIQHLEKLSVETEALKFYWDCNLHSSVHADEFNACTSEVIVFVCPFIQ